MSKERDALKKAIGIINFTHPNTWHEFISEVEELLAQPEHIEDKLAMVTQEPVAWCQMVEGKVQDLLTSFEMKDWLYDESWIPLYLPPKCEPLSDEEIKILYDRHAFAMDKQEYIWGFRDAEKAHGIGGGE